MKLRIRGNSIRLRLTRTEVDAFQEFGSVADVLEIPGGPISYALEKCQEDKLNVKRLGDSIRVGLPTALADQWLDDGCVGFQEQQSIGARSIEITVEKDFQCTTPIDCGEETSDDLYPNPNS